MIILKDIVSIILVQWHWKVFLNIEYWSYLDIPNLQTVTLPNAFQKVYNTIVNSNYWSFQLIIDVSELLFPEVYTCDFIQSLNSSTTSIIIPNWTCNINNYTIFDFSRFTLLESIEIGNDSFGSVSTFQIDGLNQLQTIKIGKNSFTWQKDGFGNNASKSFHILNCESLESIQIDLHSFSDFGGEFELKNLTQLQSIQIGEIGSNSNSFRGSSFVIRGIELKLTIIMNRSSKSTIHYFGLWCIYSFNVYNNREYWMNLNEMIWIDLPSLQSITLGRFALYGSSSSTSSLTMRSKNEMIRNDGIQIFQI